MPLASTSATATDYDGATVVGYDTLAPLSSRSPPPKPAMTTMETALPFVDQTAYLSVKR